MRVQRIGSETHEPSILNRLHRGQDSTPVVRNLIGAIGSYDFRGRYPEPIGRAEGELLGACLKKYLLTLAITATDTRKESRAFLRAVSRGIRRSGTRVIHLGMVPTAVVGFAARTWRLPALAFTPSHNPLGFVGLKGFTERGRLWSAEWTRLTRDLATTPPVPSQHRRPGALRKYQSPTRHSEVRVAYFHHFSSLAPLHIRVVVDARGGAASRWATGAFRALGADVVPVHDRPSPTFLGCSPAPTPASLSDLSSRVVSCSADLGVTFDGDADRILIVDRQGRYLWPEVVALGLLASGHPPGSPVIATADASPRLSKWAPVSWSPRGTQNVVDQMRKVGAPVGFETSDHYNLRSEGYLSDGIAIGLRISKLVSSNEALLQGIAGHFARMQRANLTFDLGQRDAGRKILPQLIRGIGGRWESHCDGFQSNSTHYGRLFLRASQTEPLLRLTVESWTSRPIGGIASRLNDYVLKILADLERASPDVSARAGKAQNPTAGSRGKVASSSNRWDRS